MHQFVELQILKKEHGVCIYVILHIYIFIYGINKCKVYLHEGILGGGEEEWKPFVSIITAEFSSTTNIT